MKEKNILKIRMADTGTMTVFLETGIYCSGWTVK